jgi:hypothetical protein
MAQRPGMPEPRLKWLELLLPVKDFHSAFELAQKRNVTIYDYVRLAIKSQVESDLLQMVDRW